MDATVADAVAAMDEEEETVGAAGIVGCSL